MTSTQTEKPLEIDAELLAQLTSSDTFFPPEPKTIVEAGLSDQFVEALICRFLAIHAVDVMDDPWRILIIRSILRSPVCQPSCKCLLASRILANVK